MGEKSSEPVIEEGLVLLVKSVYTDEVQVEVMDAARDMEVVGWCAVQVWTLLEEPGMQCPLQLRPLLTEQYSDKAEIIMSSLLRGLKSPSNGGV